MKKPNTMNHRVRLTVAALLALPGLAVAQSTAVPNPAASMLPVVYGAPIPLADAKRIAAGAVAEAQKIGIPMVVAVTDPAGQLVYFERMDGAIAGGVQVAQQKAASAALYKRPTKAFEDAVAAGGVGVRFLRLDRAVPIEGGLPIVVDGKLVGAIGASGGSGVQDGQVAKAGIDQLK